LERSRFQEGKFWLEKSVVAQEKTQNAAAILLAARAIGFHGFGRSEQPTAEFADLYPSLIGEPFVTDPDLEQRRQETAATAHTTAEATFPAGLPVWASPAPSGETMVEVNDGALSPVGTTLYTAMDDGSLRSWDLVSGMEGLKLAAHTTEATCVAASSDGSTVASGSEDGKLVLMEGSTGKVLHKIDAHGEWIRRVAFSPDGMLMASASGDKTVKLWDVKSGVVLRTLTGHGDEVADVVFSRDGLFMATASSDQTLKLWESVTGKELRTLSGHTGVVTAVAFTSDDRQLVSSSKDGSLRLWDVGTGEQAQILDPTGSGDVVRVAASPNGNWVATSGRTGVSRMHDIANQRIALHSEAHGKEINGLMFQPDGRRLITTSRDGVAKLWDVDDGQLVYALEQQATALRVGVFSMDSRLVAAGEEDGSVTVFDGGSRQLIARLEGHTKPVTALRFSMDGNTLISAAEGGVIIQWNLATASAAKTLQGDASDVSAMALSPDDALLATATVDRVVTLWDLAEGKALHRVLLGDFEAGRLTFSADGKQLAVAQSGMESLVNDATIESAATALKLWSVADMKELTPPPMGQRAALSDWLTKADHSFTQDRQWMTSLWERQVMVYGAESQLAPPDLVTLLDTGLLTLSEGLVGAATEGHKFSGPPLTFGNPDTFGQLIESGGDPSMHLRLCAELSQVPTAQRIWRTSAAKLNDQARRDYVLLMASAGEADDVAAAVTKAMLDDPGVLAAIKTLLRSLPADARTKLENSLKDKATADWLLSR